MRILVLCLILTCVSCKNTTPLPPRLDSISQTRPAKQVVDLSGDWEKDYGRSDNFETVFQEQVLKIQDYIERLQRNGNRDYPVNAGDTLIPGRESVIGLARITEEITRMPVLHIEQDQVKVKIDRENDFALQCKFFEQQISTRSDTFGTESCRWNRGQLLIQIILQDDLKIDYQITLGPDGQELNITTTVVSNEVSFPLTISNYYYRYTPPESDFDCVQTLTRNDVCKRSRD